MSSNGFDRRRRRRRRRRYRVMNASNTTLARVIASHGEDVISDNVSRKTIPISVG